MSEKAEIFSKMAGDAAPAWRCHRPPARLPPHPHAHPVYRRDIPRVADSIPEESVRADHYGREFHENLVLINDRLIPAKTEGTDQLRISIPGKKPGTYPLVVVQPTRPDKSGSPSPPANASGRPYTRIATCARRLRTRTSSDPAVGRSGMKMEWQPCGEARGGRHRRLHKSTM
jgi:hypothetical protein